MTDYKDRLSQLRSLLKNEGLDGFIVPMADEYQNEFIADHDKRIKYLSGFTGSAGFIIVLMDQALFFTDSRYTLQAQKQIPTDLFKIIDIADKLPSEWVAENLPSKLKIGFDPHLHTTKQIERLEVCAFKQNGIVVAVNANPIDTLWKEQPEKPFSPTILHEEKFAGETSTNKRRKICEVMRAQNIKAVVITDPASVAWLLNVRGSDVPQTPLPLSMLILHQDESVDWFIDPRKVSPETSTALDSNITRHTPDDFEQTLKDLGRSQETIQIDPDLTSYFVTSTLRKAGARLKQATDPCILPRACKNKTEIKGMIAAHERDGLALIHFLSWLDQQIEQNNKVTEMEVDQKLTELREQGQHYKDLSFSTIAGSGPNGAIVHYAATKETNRTIQNGDFLLIDSGAQYLDGTTDVTRTIPIGEVSDEMNDRYTRVLKGHIDLAKVRFPQGITGASLDTLARQYLWDVGLDFGHGTGHGVGSYLCVHEGPQNISRRSNVALRPGMVLSNEPGYYKDGAYGIRHENLQYVVELKSISMEHTKMLGFRPLTLAPFDTRALLVDMLTQDERAWLNEYHTYVYDTLAPHLDEAEKAWLKDRTAKV